MSSVRVYVSGDNLLTFSLICHRHLRPGSNRKVLMMRTTVNCIRCRAVISVGLNVKLLILRLMKLKHITLQTILMAGAT